MAPKNGLYLTQRDFETWNDYFGRLVESGEDDLAAKTVTFVVTEQCNLRCTYCYEPHKSSRRMSKEVARDAVDFLFDAQKVNGYYTMDQSPGVILEFIGGEPLLEVDIIDYIVEYFKFKAFAVGSPWATNYMISLASNGILYKSEKVQRFLKKNKGKASIAITIDGNKRLHDACRVFADGRGSYDIVEDAVLDWLKQEALPQTKITLSPDNVMFLNEALQGVWNLGIVGALTNCVFEEGWTLKDAHIFHSELIKLADFLLTDENYRRYYTTLFAEDALGTPTDKGQPNWCGGNGKMLCIGTDGKCYPCLRFMGYSLSTPGREEKSIGDIYKGLDSKDSNPWLCELKKITMDSQSPEKCKNCQIASGCALCTGYNYDKFGDPNKRATYICDMHHARVLANVYYWNKLYKSLGIEKTFANNVPLDWGAG